MTSGKVENIPGRKNERESPVVLGSFFRLLFFLASDRVGHPLGHPSAKEK